MLSPRDHICVLEHAFRDSLARTSAMAPLSHVLGHWDKLGGSERRMWGETVARRTIREILPIALRAAGRVAAAAEECEREYSLRSARAAAAVAATEYWDDLYTGAAGAGASAARDAARAAADAAWEAEEVIAAVGDAARAAVAERAAWAAVHAAEAAEAAGGTEARHRVLTRACDIWREALVDLAVLEG